MKSIRTALLTCDYYQPTPAPDPNTPAASRRRDRHFALLAGALLLAAKLLLHHP